MSASNPEQVRACWCTRECGDSDDRDDPTIRCKFDRPAATEVRVDANEREKFEAWWNARYRTDAISSPTGSVAWLAWQASLASAPRAAGAVAIGEVCVIEENRPREQFVVSWFGKPPPKGTKLYAQAAAAPVVGEIYDCDKISWPLPTGFVGVMNTRLHVGTKLYAQAAAADAPPVRFREQSLRACVKTLAECLEPHARQDLNPDGVQVKSGQSRLFWSAVSDLATYAPPDPEQQNEVKPT